MDSIRAITGDWRRVHWYQNQEQMEKSVRVLQSI